MSMLSTLQINLFVGLINLKAGSGQEVLENKNASSHWHFFGSDLHFG